MKPRPKQLITPDTKVLLKRILTGVMVITAVVLLFVAVWHGTRVESLTVDVVRVYGGQTIKHEKVASMAKRTLEGEYLGLIPRKFAWFYPKSEISESLRSIERIHNISINRVSGTEIAITFDEYTPKALWCMSVNSDECLFLDDVGYAFGHAPKLAGGSFLRFVETNRQPGLYESISSVDSYDSLLLLVELLANQSWFIFNIEIDQAGDAFLQVVDGGELKVALSQSSEKTVENLFTILASKEFAHIEPGNFQYIDLRYGNKVFVNEEIAAPEGEAKSEERVEVELD